MKYFRIVGSILLLNSFCIANNLVFVEFLGKDFDSNLVFIKELEQIGATARHIFAPNSAILDMHGLSSVCLRDDSNKYVIYSNEDQIIRGLNFDNLRSKQVFLHLIATQEESSAATKQSDTYIVGCIDNEGLSKAKVGVVSQKMTTLTDRLNGQYMIGHIAVGIYLMEFNGSQENWWPAAEQQTFNEIVEGLDWLADSAFHRGAKVVWVYAPVEKINTKKELTVRSAII